MRGGNQLDLTQKTFRHPLLHLVFFAALYVCWIVADTHKASAGCSTSGTTATCTGSDVADVSFDSNGIETVNVEDLAANATGTTTAISLIDTHGEANNHGDSGKTGADLTVTIDAGDFGVVSSGNGINVQSEGGKGHSGKNDSNGHGGSGGGGGSGGIVVVTQSSGNLDLSSAGADSVGVTAQSIGGLANTGGDGNSNGTDDGKGGDGGTGGAGQMVTVTLGSTDTAIETVTLSGATGILATSTGGDAGKGGEGSSGELSPKATGGDGGDGGAGGAVEVTIQNITTAEINVAGNGIEASSVGGNAGEGGEGKNEYESHGGKGGTGGAGDDVTVTISKSTLTIETSASATSGETSHGIYGGSIAGNGAKGGPVSSITADGPGGNGGDGGNSSTVTITSDSDATLKISTSDDNAHGIFGESVAGSGGEGNNGEGVSGTGGDGGHGGTSDTVTIDVNAELIETTGTQSQGIYGRSFGGAGGDAGSNNGVFGESGAAKAPGPGGNVNVTFDGEIQTGGTEANGIFVQSVGGFGGDAGSSGTFVSYGQSGESGGAGGTVTVTLQSGTTISTQGSYASGIDAQSVGGGGGKGSDSDGIVALGSSGDSSGGDGGTAAVYAGSSTDDTISITTTGDHSRAISGTSRGGGGGDAGSSSGVTSVGGSGGTGGNGGAVDVENYATLSTMGDYADGIYAASLGGGGGSAHSTSGISSIGGSGGSGGTGGTIIANSSGADITTTGISSDGIYLQSVGGGGGSGSNALSIGVDFTHAVGGKGGGGGNAGAVYFIDDGNGGYTVSTQGDQARGIFVQSTGGGGGDGGNAVSVSANIGVGYSLGGSGKGSQAGNGDEVIVEISGDIQTSGAHSVGLFAQSLGGGGGTSGSTTALDSGVAMTSYTSSVGASGGGGGNGGEVSVKSTGGISTQGQNAQGILALSQGGGGGHSGQTISGSSFSISSLTLSTGGSGGTGGSGAAVSVSAFGSVSTGGDNSDAILAQSLGGGGGNSGTTISADGISTQSTSIATGGSGGGGGDADSVLVISTGKLETAGDNSSGILAQSLGGGGGNSGATISGTLGAATSLGFTLGGSGGGGGNSSKVTVLSSSAINTEGSGSYGINAQSSGGNGGNSGLSISADAVSAGSLTMSIEGDGGTGGTSTGKVIVDNFGNIMTTGGNASAIFAHSQGGGGGSATGTIDTNGATMGAIGISIGGSGGSGGTGGDVKVNNFAALSTEGLHSTGIHAQSTGGDGGHGGYAIYGSVTAGEYSGNIDVGWGGAGGSGGKGGDIAVINDGTIGTADYGSDGIFAQSIGGAGGSGGAAISGVISVASGATAQVGVTLGGTGGSGNAGGDVHVGNGGDITTSGFYSNAIYAHSVGGNGGSGGMALAASASASNEGTLQAGVTVGGAGGDSSVGGDVTVTNNGALTTVRGGSVGIYAQSVGGDGGDGGSAGTILFDGTLGSGESATIQLSATVGGTGGTGSNAGAVTVENFGRITTYGRVSDGIFAQSVGGGGGDGGAASGFNFAIEKSSKGSVSGSASVSIGGSGGAGGDGNTVEVINTGEITTVGRASYGIYAHSVGGGGGNGGDGSDGIDAWTDNQTIIDIVSDLDSINDIANLLSDYESLATDWSIVIGGSAGAGGNGDTVDVTNLADITTYGDSATAIHTQSIGGGGGSGGDGLGGIVTKATVAGSGGAGGDGESVTVTNAGDLLTAGSGAMGIFAQSIGSGGGSAGDVELAFFSSSLKTSFGVGVAASASAGNGGDAKDVTVTTDGSITTLGSYAHGIWAQSIGGGGGAYGIGTTVAANISALSGSSGAYGDSGNIEVTINDAINVYGDYAVGVFAQSASGADTAPGDTGGNTAAYTYSGDGIYTSGTVTINANADVISSGDYGRALVAQSDGYDSADTITINVASGATVSTTEDGYDTITLLDGNANVLTNYGTIEKEEGDSVNHYVVYSDIANEFNAVAPTSTASLTIDNYGVLSGSVSLYDSVANTVTNQDGGTMNIGLEFDLGSSSSFENDGTLSPGGTGNIISSTVTSKSFTQSASGMLQTDVNIASDDTITADLITFALGDPTFAGTVGVVMSATSSISSDESGSVTILEASSGTFDSAALSVTDSATVDYSLSASGSDKIDLSFDVSLTGFGGDSALESSNNLKTARYVEALLDSENDVSFLDRLLTELLNVPTMRDLNAIYDRVSVEESALPVTDTITSSLNFQTALNSCPAYEPNGNANFNRQGECVWGRLGGTHFNQSQNQGMSGYDLDEFELTTGRQFETGDNTFVGIGLGYGLMNWSGDTFTGDGYRLQLGGIVKQEINGTTLSAALAGGFYDTTIYRETGLGTAAGTPQGWLLSGGLRASHMFDHRRFGVKPILGLAVTQVWQNSYTEAGTSGLNMKVDSISQTALALRPAVEVSSGIDVGGMQGRAWVRTGATAYLTGHETSITTGFANQPAGSPALVLTHEKDRYFGEISAGLDLTIRDNATLSLSADTAFSENTWSAGGSAKFRLKF